MQRNHRAYRAVWTGRTSEHLSRSLARQRRVALTTSSETNPQETILHGTTKEPDGYERMIEKLAQMRKVYLRILPLTMVMYFLCYIDRINVSFAALTMNKDIGLMPGPTGSVPVHSTLAMSCSRSPAT